MNPARRSADGVVASLGGATPSPKTPRRHAASLISIGSLSETADRVNREPSPGSCAASAVTTSSTGPTVLSLNDSFEAVRRSPLSAKRFVMIMTYDVHVRSMLSVKDYSRWQSLSGVGQLSADAGPNLSTFGFHAKYMFGSLAKKKKTSTRY